MSKIAFIFPGQGAQYVGMANEFYEAIPECHEVFDIAEQVLDFNIRHLCFHENELIHKTEYTQAIMLTACLSILRAVEKSGIKADMTAGLSLGEYAALVANSMLAEADAIRLVRKRGIYMTTEVPAGKGGMAAVLGLDNQTVEQVCEEISLQEKSIVEPANYNCPGQIVISGESKALKVACDVLSSKAKRVLPLTVSGPFHSSMLKGAGSKLALELEKVSLQRMRVPYASNVTGSIQREENQVKTLLVEQVSSSVRWQQCVEEMIANGVDTFIEIGPGRTLSGFIKKIDRTKKVLNIEKLADLEKLEELKK